MEFIWRTLTRPTLSQGGRPSDFHEADELPSFDQSMAAMESIGLLTATVLRGARLRERGATDRNTHSWRTRFAFCPFRTSAHLDRGTPSLSHETSRHKFEDHGECCYSDGALALVFQFKVTDRLSA